MLRSRSARTVLLVLWLGVLSLPTIGARGQDRETSAAGAKSAEDRIRAALDEPASLAVQELPLRDLVPRLRELTGANVFLERKTLDDIGLADDVPVSGEFRNVSLRSILNLLLRPIELTWIIDDGALVITARQEAEGRLNVRVYNVTDLIATSRGGRREYDAHDLIAFIESIVEPHTWDSLGGPGSLEGFGGTLVVQQTEQVQQQVAALLVAVRQGKSIALKADDAPAAPVSIRVRPAAETAILDALQEPSSLDLKDMPLFEVAAELERTLGVPVVIDRRALDDVGLGDQAAISVTVEKMPAGQAMHHLLRSLELTWQVRDEALIITTPEEAEMDRETRLYPVRDLAESEAGRQGGELWRPDPLQRLVDLIVSSVANETWAEVGGLASIEPLPGAGVLGVSQTLHVHQQIEDLLTNLRETAAEAPAAAAEELPHQKFLKLEIYNIPTANPPQPAARVEASVGSGLGGGGISGGFTPGPPIPGEELVELITTLVAPDSWRREGVAIRAVPGRLIVRQTDPVQRDVKEFLSRLKLVHNPPPYAAGAFGGGGFF